MGKNRHIKAIAFFVSICLVLYIFHSNHFFQPFLSSSAFVIVMNTPPTSIHKLQYERLREECLDQLFLTKGKEKGWKETKKAYDQLATFIP